MLPYIFVYLKESILDRHLYSVDIFSTKNTAINACFSHYKSYIQDHINPMYTKVFISLMIILCFLGMLLGVILYFGFDPTFSPLAGIMLMGISVFLTGWSLIGLVLLLCKKISSRGFLYPISAFRAFRHGLLIALWWVMTYIFYIYSVLTIVTWFLLVCIVFLLELILTKTEDI
jgi:hypothetical protein